MWFWWNGYDYPLAGHVLQSLRKAAATEDDTIVLQFLDSFMDRFPKYSEPDIRKILNALRSIRLTELHVGFNGYDFSKIYASTTPTRGAKTITRIDMLTEVLGSISTLKTMKINYNDGSLIPQFDIHLLRGLKQIECLEIGNAYRTSFYDDDDPLVHEPEQLARLTECLDGHPSLRTLVLQMNSKEFIYDEGFLRLVQAIPFLETVRLEYTFDNFSHSEFDLPQTKTICELFKGPQKIRAVAFVGLSFLTAKSSQALCKGIRGATIEEMVFRNCILANYLQFAQAIASSSIKKLEISSWRGHPACRKEKEKSSELFTAIGANLSESSKLEEIYFQFFLRLCEFPPDALAQAAAIRGALKCPNLRRLSIGLDTSNSVALLDETLALRLKENSCLEEVMFEYSPNTGNTSLELPCMFQSLRTNFTLKTVTFKQDEMDGREDFAVCDKQLEIVLRLNRGGRVYMATEPSNLVKALQVLGSVNDSLDSLFYHLRENPSIVARKASERKATTTTTTTTTTTGKLSGNKRNDPGQSGQKPPARRRARQKSSRR